MLAESFGFDKDTKKIYDKNNEIYMESGDVIHERRFSEGIYARNSEKISKKDAFHLHFDITPSKKAFLKIFNVFNIFL